MGRLAIIEEEGPTPAAGAGVNNTSSNNKGNNNKRMHKGTSDESGYFEGDMDSDHGRGCSSASSGSGSIEIVYENNNKCRRLETDGKQNTRPAVSVTPLLKTEPQNDASKNNKASQGIIENNGKPRP